MKKEALILVVLFWVFGSAFTQIEKRWHIEVYNGFRSSIYKNINTGDLEWGPLKYNRYPGESYSLIGISRVIPITKWLWIETGLRYTYVTSYNQWNHIVREYTFNYSAQSKIQFSIYQKKKLRVIGGLTGEFWPLQNGITANIGCYYDISHNHAISLNIEAIERGGSESLGLNLGWYFWQKKKKSK